MDAAQLLEIGTLLADVARFLDSDPSKARETCRKALSTLERATERRFNSLPEFIRSALDYLPLDPDAPNHPWFLSWDDPRSRLMGVQEQVSGDRLTITLTAVRDAPEEWRPFVQTYFRTTSARHMLACMITENTLADLPEAFA